MQDILRIQKPIETAIPYGRLRIFLRSVYHDETAAHRLDSSMRTAKGVLSVCTNPVTGRVLVVYNASETSDYELCRLLYVFDKSRTTSPGSNIIDFGEIAKRRGPCDNDKSGTAGTDVPVPAAAAPQYHCMSSRYVGKVLQTDLKQGLTTAQVQELQKNCGLNVLSEKKKKSLIAKLLGNLFDFTNKLLLGVGIVSCLAGQIPDAIAIFGIVAIQTILSTLQSHKAENSIASLKGMLVNKAKVIRDGRERIIASRQLVPGDIIVVEGGDLVPADARIIESTALKTTEASLTGESEAVGKSAEPCRENTALSGRRNMLYMGSNVLCGRAKAVVTATGMKTELGKIASMLQGIRQDVPPIKKRILRLTKTVTIAAGCASLLFAGFGLLSGKSVGEALVLSICFSIGAVPESLPAVVTASMAMSVQRMARKKIIVRNLPAVETLGSTDVICCDKTGTLTMNEMTVRRLYAGGVFYTATGTGYQPNGQILPETGNAESKEALELLLRAGVLCNNASLSQENGRWSAQGDPTEGALLTVAGKYGMDTSSVMSGCRRISEIPFDSSRQCMVTHTADTDGEIAYCKGAYGKVAEKCSLILKDGREQPFLQSEKEEIRKICGALGDEALRVLAFSYKKTGGAQRDLDADHVFLGLMGMSDPARPSAAESIRRFKSAGVRVVMITGDNGNTAAEIARQVGLLTDGDVVTGADLDAMTDDALAARISGIQVFARTCPEQKHRIVKALKKAGHTVAMVGDGVNDAPAMKEADVGIAMGRNGSDVAKDVAGITLVEDDLSALIDAIIEGRSVTRNIRNALKYLLTGSIGEIAALALCSTFFGVLPLLSIQILWVNVITETIVGSALAIEPPCADVMDMPPYDRQEPLLSRGVMKQIIKNGALIGLATFGIFGGAMAAGLGLAKARTLAFSTLILSQMVYARQCRSQCNRKMSGYMGTAMTAAALLLLGILYCRPLQSFFGTVPLGPVNAGTVCLTGAIGGVLA